MLTRLQILFLNNYISSAKAFGFRMFFINDSKLKSNSARLSMPIKCYGRSVRIKQVSVNYLSSYLKTKFACILLSLAKISKNGMAKIYRFVPLQDFFKLWTAAELYAKYGLTDEEVAFIEATIKPMEGDVDDY